MFTQVAEKKEDLITSKNASISLHIIDGITAAVISVFVLTIVVNVFVPTYIPYLNMIAFAVIAVGLVTGSFLLYQYSLELTLKSLLFIFFSIFGVLVLAYPILSYSVSGVSPIVITTGIIGLGLVVIGILHFMHKRKQSRISCLLLWFTGLVLTIFMPLHEGLFGASAGDFVIGGFGTVLSTICAVQLTLMTRKSKLAEEYVEQGRIYHIERKLTEALNHYSKALAIDHKNYLAWIEKGDVYFDLKMFEDAAKCYEQANAIHPTLRGYGNRGIALLNMQNYDDAILNLQIALEFDPTFSTLWNAKGDAHFLMKDYDGALGCYQSAAVIEPKEPTLKLKVALAQYFSGRYEDARNTLLQFCEITKPETIEELARKIHNFGDEIEVKRFLEFVTSSLLIPKISIMPKPASTPVEIDDELLLVPSIGSRLLESTRNDNKMDKIKVLMKNIAEELKNYDESSEDIEGVPERKKRLTKDFERRWNRIQKGETDIKRRIQRQCKITIAHYRKKLEMEIMKKSLSKAIKDVKKWK